LKGLLGKLELELRDSSFTGNILLCKLLSGEDLEYEEFEGAFKEIEVSISQTQFELTSSFLRCTCSLFSFRRFGLQLDRTLTAPSRS